ncbi:MULTISPECIES: hypothetical protein [Marinovum]|nr:hypothetical protein [Marinovum sp. PR37]AKO97609.1 hypothetical protein MALG_02445 [Marinovum algicola DG 898]MDD9744270.1 hypothetical protein [Marinovum sp. PR37]
MTETAKDNAAPLPDSGGSYTREADGSLTPNPAPKKPGRKRPAKAAEKEA